MGLGHDAARFDDELASHVQLHIDDNIRAGMSPAEARRAALLALGAFGALRDDYRDRLGVPLARVIADAAREGVRHVRRHPGFSVAIISLLSVGVGATAALTRLVDLLVFRPPAHVINPGEIVEVTSAPNYLLFQEVARSSRTLDVAAVSTRPLSLGRGDLIQPAEVQCVTSSYFRVLGATPLVGRAFLPADDARGGPLVALLSYSAWRRLFGSDPAAIGRSVTVAGRHFEIVGVAPPDFRGLHMAPVGAWIPITAAPELCSFSGQSALDSVGSSWLSTIGRLRSGVTIEQADTEVMNLELHILRSPGRSAPVRAVEAIESTRGRSQDRRLAIWLSVGAGLVLMIACANVAGLFAVQTIERRREMWVRVQLGASRGRVWAQLVTEHLLLAFGGVIGAWAIAAVVGRALEPHFPLLHRDSSWDGRSMVALSLFGISAGVLAGLMPAVQGTRMALTGGWRAHHAVAHARARSRSALVITQMAFALILVSCAGQFAASVSYAKSGLGYDLDRVLVATLDLETAGVRRQAEKRRIFEGIPDLLRTLAGIESSALTSSGPLGSGRFEMVMPSASGASALPRTINYVSADYFRTAGTRVVEGRPFDASDGVASARVAIMDSALARDMWPGEAVTGRCKPMGPNQPCVTIVGLSESRRIGSLTRPSGEIFYPLPQNPSAVPQVILVRLSRTANDLIPAVTTAIRQVVPEASVVSVTRLEDLANASARSWRLGAALFGVFGVVAVGLAAVGLYTLLAFAIRQRTAEIGVRVALGATAAGVVRMTLGQSARLMVAGLLLGLAGSAILATSIRSLLFGVEPINPLTLTLASAVVVVAGLAGSVAPAIRAARIDPVAALRSE
jgi:putative ABC transport system permease protein